MLRNGLSRPELNPGPCELRTMPRCVPVPSDDVTVYLVLEDFGQLGRAFLETDIGEADRETIIRNFISGEYEKPCGWSPSTPRKAGRGMCPKTSPAGCWIEPSTPTTVSAITPSSSSTVM